MLVPKRLAYVLGLSWALAIGGVESYMPGLPDWARYAIASAGTLLGVFGVPSPWQTARADLEAARPKGAASGANTWPA